MELKVNSAKNIVAKFGGQSALAEMIGKRQSNVGYWVKKGVIPAAWHTVLLELAAKKSINLQPSDFLPAQERENKLDLLPAEEFPRATHWGELSIGEKDIPCYVLSNGDRVFSLKGIVVGLIGTEGGQLIEYLKVKALQPHLPSDLLPAENGEIPALIKFDTGGEGFTKYATGIKVEKFNDLLKAYSNALIDHYQSGSDSTKISLTDRQMQIATSALRFLQASAGVGLVALVDEATGYQYERAVDALQLKLKLFLEEDMRKWEKTFPDELWKEFGRLTNWKGAAHQRPKYWGKLIMELIYGYLDHDVAKWLKENAPKPISGQSYHQWLSGQYGLKKLSEHIWMVIGMASACHNMPELRQRMAEKYGRKQVQMTLYLPIDS